MLNLTEIIIFFLLFIILIVLLFIIKYPTLLIFLFKDFFKSTFVEYTIFVLIIFLSFLISFTFIFNDSYYTKLNLALQQNLGNVDAVIYHPELTNIQKNELNILINNLIINETLFDALIPLYINYTKINNIQSLLININPVNLLFLVNDISLFEIYKDLNFDEIIVSQSLANKNNLKESDIVELVFNNTKYNVKIKKIYSDNGIIGFDFPISEFSNFVTGSILVSDKFFFNQDINSNNDNYTNFVFLKYKNIEKLNDSDLFKINTIVKKVNSNLIFFEIRKFLLNNLMDNNINFLSVPQLILLIILPLILFIYLFLFIFMWKLISLSQINKFSIHIQILKNYGLKTTSLSFLYLTRFLILGFIGSVLGFFFNIVFGDFLSNLIFDYFNLKRLLNFKLTLSLEIFLQSISFTVILIFLLCLLIIFTKNFFFDNLCFAKFRVLKDKANKLNILDFNNVLFIGLLIVFSFYIWQYDFNDHLNLRNFLIFSVFFIIFIFFIYKAYKLLFINKKQFIIIFFSSILVFSFLSFFFFNSFIKNFIGIVIVLFFLILFSFIGLLIFFLKQLQFLNINLLIFKILYERIILVAFSTVSVAFTLFSTIFLSNVNLFGFGLLSLEKLILQQNQVNSLTIFNLSGNLDIDLIKKDIRNISNEIDIFIEWISLIKFEFNNLSYYKNIIFNDNVRDKDIKCLSEDTDCLSEFFDGKGIFINNSLYTNIIGNQKVNSEEIFNVNLKFTNEQFLSIPIIGVLKDDYYFNNIDLLGSKILLNDINLNFTTVFKIYLFNSDIETKTKIINYFTSNYGQYINVIDNSEVIGNIILFFTKLFNLFKIYIFFVFVILICWVFLALNKLIILKNLWIEIFYSLTYKLKFAVFFTLNFIILILISFCLLLYFIYFYFNNILYIQLNLDIYSIIIDFFKYLIILGFIIFIFVNIIFLFFVNFFNEKTFFNKTAYFRY